MCGVLQFALFYQKRPFAVISGVDPALPVFLTNVSATLKRITAGNAAAEAGVAVSLIRLTRNDTTNALQLPGIELDGSDSYDPDGTVEGYAWSAQGLSTGSYVASANVTPSWTAAVTAAATGPGVVQVTLEVRDADNGTRAESVAFWLDAPPVAVVAPPGALTPTPTRPAHGQWPDVTVHAAAGDTASVTLSGERSYDPEGADVDCAWVIVPASLRPRYSRPGSTPVVGSPSGNSKLAVVSGVPAGSILTVQVTATATDGTESSDVGVAKVVVNAKPVARSTAPAVVYLQQLVSSFNASAALSVDHDGTIVRRSWSVSQPSGHYSTFAVAGDVVTVANVTEPGSYALTLELEDNDGGVTQQVFTVDVRPCTTEDSDADGTNDCFDGCPNDAAKTEPGMCGCGVAESAADTDGDGVLDCLDECPNNAAKQTAGQCGCNAPDADSDGDIVLDCVDGCPEDSNKQDPGQCGCGVVEDTRDEDSDGVLACKDSCPQDPDNDSDGDGVCAPDDACPDSDTFGPTDTEGCSLGDRCACKEFASDVDFVACVEAAATAASFDAAEWGAQARVEYIRCHGSLPEGPVPSPASDTSWMPWVFGGAAFLVVSAIIAVVALMCTRSRAKTLPAGPAVVQVDATATPGVPSQVMRVPTPPPASPELFQKQTPVTAPVALGAGFSVHQADDMAVQDGLTAGGPIGQFDPARDNFVGPAPTEAASLSVLDSNPLQQLARQSSGRRPTALPSVASATQVDNRDNPFSQARSETGSQ